MKILYIHQYFVEPTEPGGTRTYWISQELIKNGHEVTMITTTRGREKPKRTVIDGINVIYLDIPYNNKMSIFQRLGSFLKFMFLSSYYVLKEKKYDLLISTSTPLTVGFPALVGKKLKGLQYVFEVRDLWPEVPIQMGGLKNKVAIKIALWFEKTIYKNSLHIVALSPGMYDGVVSRDIPENKVSMIPNMSKIDAFWSRNKNLGLMEDLGLQKDSFKIIYFGAMGLANAMHYIVDAANMLRNEKDIEFVFLGHGAMQPIMEERSIKEKIPNMNFYGRVPMDKLSEIVNICDVSLVTFSNLPILATNSPNKLFDSLSAGKPIIVNSPGWTKKMVENNECGVFTDPESPKALVEAILKLKSNPVLCEKMGKNARELAVNKYDKSILCKEFGELIEQVTQ